MDDEEGAPQPHDEAGLGKRVEQLEAEVARLRASLPRSGVEEREEPELPLRGWRRAVAVTAKVLFVVVILNGVCAQGVDAVREYRRGHLDNGILLTFGFLVSLAICSVIAKAVLPPWLQARRNRDKGP